MTHATQNEQVVALLRQRGERGLTPLDALDVVGSLRLGARIWDVRNRDNGYLRDDEEIVTERATSVDPDGETKSFARYVLRQRITPEGLVSQGTLWSDVEERR